MTTPETITALKDITLALAAIVTAGVAILGLKGWQRELRGRAAFDVARNLARATYRLRDELRNCRAPFYSAHEFPVTYKGNTESSREEQAAAWSHVYGNRWSPVLTALQDFDSLTLEAEALWGTSIRTKTDALRDCLKDLQTAMQAIISDKASGGQDFGTNRELGKKMRAIATASPSDDKNEFSRKLADAITQIEEQLRPHLKR